MTTDEFLKEAGIRFITDVLDYEFNNELSFNFDFSLPLSDGRVVRIRLQEED